ncbi:MAG: alpha/beta hydrolase [Rhodoferax sp.]|nr:alpha/beta hydrolase [Rhodoferax sp.]
MKPPALAPQRYRTPVAALVLGLLLCWAVGLGTWVAPAAHATTLLERFKERRDNREPDATAKRSTEQGLWSPYGAREQQTDTVRDGKILRDIAYGNDPKQRMDVYLPTGGSVWGAAPVIFMVHGGAWRTGDKRMSKVVDNKAARWLPKGFVFVSVNNRLLPEADPLDQVHDIAQALALAQSRAGRWGANPAQFVLMGHSAGAHLVALLAASPTLAAQHGAQAWLGTIALDSAALDVPTIMQRRHYRLYDPAFGTNPTYWAATSPLQQLHSGAKPLLAVCSTRRDDSCSQAQAFARQAERLGVRAEVLRQDLSHGDINEQLGLPGDYTAGVERFMASLSTDVAQRLRETPPDLTLP